MVGYSLLPGATHLVPNWKCAYVTLIVLLFVLMLALLLLACCHCCFSCVLRSVTITMDVMSYKIVYNGALYILANHMDGVIRRGITL
jgi:hypothetical protein